MAQEGNLWFSIGADNTQFQRTANDTNRKLTEMSNNVREFSKGITASFVEAAKSMAGFYSVAKAGSMFQELIQKNDQFNKSMREVSTLSEDVAKNLESYKQQILDMSTQIPIAADDAAKALYQINSAGHTGADGMKVLEESAKAAIGGVTDTITAADTITTVLNAYKMASSDAASVSDKLFTAVKLGKTSMSELGASIAQVAPMAASFGISIDQVLSAIATLTKNGTPTAQAVTQIRAAIVSLSSTLGATYFQTHTLQQGMIAMREAFPDQNELKKTAGTIEAVNAILAMSGDAAKGAAEDLREFENSAGAAGEAFGRMNNGKGTELAKLQNNIMKEMSKVNDQISATIAKVAKAMNDAFDSGQITEYLDTVKDLITVYGIYKATAILATAAQKAYNLVMEEYQYQVALANIGASTYGGTLGAVETETIAVTGAQAAQSTVMGLLSRAWQTLTATMMANPFGLAAVGVAALAFAIYKVVDAAKEEEQRIKGVTGELDKYGRTAEEAKTKTEELKKAYSDNNAKIIEMIKRLKNFKGSKEDEKKLVQECNDKYGDAMGYYSSVADWYKVLTQNSKTYCQQMINEAEIRALANQAAENNQKINDIKYNSDGTVRKYDTQKRLQATGDAQGNITITRTGASDQEIASRDLATLRRDNENIKKRMGALMEQNAKLATSMKTAPNGTTQTTAPDKTTATIDSNAEKAAEKAKKAEEERRKVLEHEKEVSENIYQEILQLQAKNEDDRIALMKDGHTKRMAEIDNEYAKEQEEIRKQATKWEKENKEAGRNDKELQNSVTIAGKAYSGLTKIQADELQKSLDNAREKMQQSTEEESKTRMQAMLDYLKEYGTVQEQRYAIAKEYEQKIADLKAGGASDYQIKAVEKQRDSEIGKSRSNELAQGIDWSQVMGSIGGVIQTVAEETLNKIDEYMKTSEYKNSSATDKKSISELRSNVKNSLNNRESAFNFSIWGDIETKTKTYQDSVKAVADANNKHIKAIKELEEAEEFLKNAKDEELDLIKQDVELAKEKVKTTGESLTNAQQDSQDKRNDLQDTSEKAVNGLNTFANALQQMNGGSLYGFANGIATLIQSLTGAGKKANQAGDALQQIGGKAGGIIGAILQIIDALGDAPAEFIGSILDKVATVVETIIEQIPYIIVKIIEGVISIIGGIFSGIGHLFGIAEGNTQEVKEVTDRNTKAIEANTERINALKDAIDKQTGVQAVATSQSAIEAQKSTNSLAMRTLQTQMSYHSNHHSNAYYADDSWIQWFYNNEVKNALNAGIEMQKSVSGLTDIYKMTPEQIAAIKTYMPALWEYLTTVGEYDKSEYWDAVVDQAGKLQEITEQVQENITGMSFDSLKDGFLSTLMDMESTSEDFAEDFAKNMTQALLNIKLGEKGGLYDELNQWYDDYYKKLSDGDLTQDEINTAKEKYNEIIAKGIQERDNIAQLTGYDDVYKQNATANGIETITEDTAQELNGRFTALQIAGENVSTNAALAINYLMAINETQGVNNAYLSDILEQHAITNSMMEDIVKYQKGMYNELNGKIQKLVDNTGKL